MSAPPPYPNQPQQPYGHQQPPQQPYGYQPPPQQQYGYQQAPPQYGNPKGPQQPHGQQQPPRGPQRQQPSALQRLLSLAVVLAVIGGVVWYVVDYNTDPNGGKAAKEASASASAKAYDEEHNAKVGDCVKLTGSGDAWEMTIVDCSSPEAQYKTGDVIGGNEKCGPQYVRSLVYSYDHRPTTTWCFTKA